MNKYYFDPMTKGRTCAFFCIVVIIGLAGCSTLSRGRPTARTASEWLERIPVGTSQSEVIQELSLSQVVITGGKLHSPKYSVHARLFVSPTRQDDLKIYRQWPSGILLELVEDDLELAVQVADVKHQEGGVFVYFDTQMRYKGYFAYSAARYSSDDPARFEKEVADYKRLGFDAEFWRAHQSMDLILAGGDALNRLPRLPLSNNRAPNPVTVMP